MRYVIEATLTRTHLVEVEALSSREDAEELVGDVAEKDCGEPTFEAWEAVAARCMVCLTTMDTACPACGGDRARRAG